MISRASWTCVHPQSMNYSKFSFSFVLVHQPEMSLHMLNPLSLQYEAVVVLLYRPFITLRSQLDTNVSEMPSPAVARTKCFNSASNVCALLAAYRRLYGLRRMHVLMVHVTLTAALIHVYCVCMVDGQDKRLAQNCLLICIQSLGELGQSYLGASRALEIINHMRVNWKKTEGQCLETRQW